MSEEVNEELENEDQVEPMGGVKDRPPEEDQVQTRGGIKDRPPE